MMYVERQKNIETEKVTQKVLKELIAKSVNNHTGLMDNQYMLQHAVLGLQ